VRIAQNEPYLLVHNLIQSDIFAQCKHGIRLKDTLLLSLFPKQLLGRVFKFVIVGQRACARPSSARKRADLLEPKRVE